MLMSGVAACAAGTGADAQVAVKNDARIDAWVTRSFDSTLAPGMSVAVVVGDSVVYLKGFGYADREAGRPATPGSIFYIASATKSFTGMAAAILDTRGTIDLDSSLAHYLPDLRLQPPLDAGTITLRDLLTHTHGTNSNPIVIRLAFTGQHDPATLERLLAKAEPLERGRKFRYSNFGYNAATIALDHALHKRWQDVLQDELFNPLAMKSTTAYVSRIDRDRLAMPYTTEPWGQARLPYGKEDSNMQSAGGLVTTAEDLSHWMIANLNSGQWNGRQALPAAAVSLAQTPMVNLDASYQGFERKQYSLGLYHGTYDGEKFMHHFGGFSGFHSHISYMPERKIGVAVLVNNDGLGSYLAVTTAKGIYEILLDRPDVAHTLDTLLAGRWANVADDMEKIRNDRERRAARPQDLPHALQAYTGTYQNEDFGTMVWTARDGRLHAQFGVAESDVEVYDGAKNQLRVELLGGGGVIEFDFDGKPLAQRLTYKGPNVVFERVE